MLLKERLSIFPPVCDSVSSTNRLLDFRYFQYVGTEVNLRKLSNKREFRENNLGDDHNIT